ncbi:MAG: RNA-directed DNA polymerase [Gammaproteobacteria bacterium]|nr:RNA-directed DNA polymerase [Gammaproteobacteria bacterium]
MFEQPKNRQELYERIRESSKDEYTLEEMIRLGFWPAEGQVAEDPADEIRERGEIQRELKTLRTEKARLQNEAAMLRELRKRRMEESRRKQQETKERREQERQERAVAWQQRKQKEIVYLGEQVSGGLNHTQSDRDRLQQYGLPLFDTPAQLAQAMGISLGALRFLAFSREVSKTSHYIRFKLPKKTGGERLISAPMPRLKQAQHWILAQLLTPLALHSAAHGFRQCHSIVSNAAPHCGKSVVINLDLRNFFPTIHYRRVKGLFHSFGYAEAVATVLALLCTEAEIETVELDGERYYVALGERYLPQGAPSSPAITNLLCRRLDRRLTGMAKKLGFIYTRYADDLSFSSNADNAAIGKLLRQCHFIVNAEGFNIHPDKTRVMRYMQHQEVTGVVVNRRRPAVSRKQLKRFRALLFQIEKDGPEGKRWNGGKEVLHSIQGFANFVCMVDPVKGKALKDRVRKIVQRYTSRG